MNERVEPSRGEPPPEPTTSRTGDGSSRSSLRREPTLELPARRCRFRSAPGLSVSARPVDAAPNMAGSGESTSRLTETCGDAARPESKSCACIFNLRSVRQPSVRHAGARPSLASVHANLRSAHALSGRPLVPVACPLGRALDQALSQGVGHGVRPVAQVQPAGDIVDDVLHGPLGEEELVADLNGVETLGQQLQYLHLAVADPAEGQPARVQDLALETADLAHQPAQ